MLYKLCEVLSFWHVFLLCVQFHTPLLRHSLCPCSSCSFPFLFWDALYKICYLISTFNRFSSIESFTISCIQTIHCTGAMALKLNISMLKLENPQAEKNTPQFNKEPQPPAINKKLKQRSQGKSEQFQPKGISDNYKIQKSMGVGCCMHIHIHLQYDISAISWVLICYLSDFCLNICDLRYEWRVLHSIVNMLLP